MQLFVKSLYQFIPSMLLCYLDRSMHLSHLCYYVYIDTHCLTFPCANQEKPLKLQLSVRTRRFVDREPDSSQQQFRTNKSTYTHIKPLCFPDISSKWDTTVSVLNHDPVLRCQSSHHFFATEIISGITKLSSSKKTAACVRERRRLFLRP